MDENRHRKSLSLYGIEHRLFSLNLSTVIPPLTNPGSPHPINFSKRTFFVEDCTEEYSIHILSGPLWEVDKGKVHPITYHEGTGGRAEV
jgi:hypothetical protein